MARVLLTDAEENAFANFTADWIMQRMTEERLAKNPVRLFGEESPLKIFLKVRLLHLFAFLVLFKDGIPLVRKQLCRDLCPRVRDDGIYEESVFHAIEQAVAEGMLTMKRDGLLKVKQGITSLEEVARSVYSLT